MNINLELYKIFFTVANYQNITKASEELRISQPAISKSIKNLEEQLGGQLFVRTKRGVILTTEGEEFYHYIKHAMEYISSAENKFTDLLHLETGSIRIGVSTTLTKEFLLPYLKEFHQLYPKIKIDIITNVSPELFSKLRNGVIDIMFLNLTNNVYENDIDIIKCKEIHDCFIINQNHSHLLGRTISLKELKNYPLIVQPEGSNARFAFDELLEKNGISLIPSLELASYSLVIEFTKIGFGIGFATKEYIQKERDQKQLFLLDLKEPIPSRHIGMATSKNHLPSFGTKKLMEMIRKDIEKKEQQ